MFDSFFHFLKKSLVAFMFVVVGFTMTYVPQAPTSTVQPVEAGGLSGIATEFTQMANNALLGAGNAISGTNLAQNTINAGANVLSWTKENVLDGIGWTIAKRIVSGMIRSLINWVNSGFQGKPAFLQDLRGFLLNIADEEVGRFIEELGGIGSFICSPFRLDVQVAIATQYQRGRNTGTQAPSCTLTGIANNIQGFISGVSSRDSLSDWIQITSTPQTYTPYGAVLTAEAAVRARIINAQGEEMSLLNFGDGFLSKKLCQTVQGSDGGTKQANCKITLPGQVIAEQVNKAVGAGQDSLIEADEINELISALIGQLANKALSGVGGLLGLSGGNVNGFDAGPSYLDEAFDESTTLVTDRVDESNTITDSIAVARSLRNNAFVYGNAFATVAQDASYTEVELNNANRLFSETQNVLTDSIVTLGELTNLNETFTTAADEDARIEALIEYTQLDIITQSELDLIVREWEREARDLGVTVDNPNTVTDQDINDLLSS